MYILLLILKIIGISLLVILGILVILLFCILFMPIRYQLKGEYQDKKLTVNARITYLFPIFVIIAGYEEKAYAKLKCFGFVLVDFLNKKEKNKKKSRKKAVSKKDKNIQLETEQVDEADQLEEYKSEEKSIYESEEKSISEERLADKIDNNNYNNTQENNERNALEDTDSGNSFLRKIKMFIEKIVDIIKKIIDFLEHLDEKMERVTNNLDDYQKKVTWFLDFVERDDTLVAFQTAKKTIVRFLNSISPKKSKVYLHIGMDDPATTGQICAFYGMLYPFIEKCVIIEPDFEQTILEGNFYFKGYITGIMFVRVLWIALFGRDLKCIRKLIKSRKKSKSNKKSGSLKEVNNE